MFLSASIHIPKHENQAVDYGLVFYRGFKGIALVLTPLKMIC